MIFVAGDTHGKIDVAKIWSWSAETRTTKQDILIQLGDFGAIWYPKSDRRNWLKDNSLQRQWLSKDFTLAIVPGNHDNWDEINKLPTIEKWGGVVQVLSIKHPYDGYRLVGEIYILMRGEVYTIEDKTFFVMGGATSQDKLQRTEGIDWWAAEVPSYAEENYAIDNLAKHNFKVDYVLAHTCPTEIGVKHLERIPRTFSNVKLVEYYTSKLNDPLSKFFQALIDMHNLEFGEWHYGHWHDVLHTKIVDTNFENGTVKERSYYCHYNDKPHQII